MIKLKPDEFIPFDPTSINYDDYYQPKNFDDEAIDAFYLKCLEIMNAIKTHHIAPYIEECNDKGLVYNIEALKLRYLKKHYRYVYNFLRNYKPYVYMTHYPWSRPLIKDRSQNIFITAANQIGKSTINIRLAINYAMNENNEWETMWTKKPTIFWYFYPSRVQAITEYEEKFRPLLSWFTEHKALGHKISKTQDGLILRFNTNINMYFKSYTQRESHLQSSTLDAIFIDEEPPVQLLDEINARLMSSGGYIRTVFTPTIGDPHFMKAFDESYRGTPVETFPHAKKLRIELEKDCMYYDDGTPAFTKKQVQIFKDSFSSDRVRNIRLKGLFQRESALLYPSYEPETCNIDHFSFPIDWQYVVSADIGSGGKNHPAALVFLAYSPKINHGVVFYVWRGDGIETSNDEIFKKYQEERKKLEAIQTNLLWKYPTAKVYDSAVKDFQFISMKNGDPFSPADKNKKDGAQTTDTLFSLGLLKLNMACPEMYKLQDELRSVSGINKEKHIVTDDLSDALRYAVMSVPWRIDSYLNGLTRVNALENLKREQTKILIKRPKLAGDYYAEGNDYEAVNQIIQNLNNNRDEHIKSLSIAMQKRHERYNVMGDDISDLPDQIDVDYDEKEDKPKLVSFFNEGDLSGSKKATIRTD